MFVDVDIQSSTFQRNKRENGDKIGKIKDVRLALINREVNGDWRGKYLSLEKPSEQFGMARKSMEMYPCNTGCMAYIQGHYPQTDSRVVIFVSVNGNVPL